MTPWVEPLAAGTRARAQERTLAENRQVVCLLEKPRTYVVYVYICIYMYINGIVRGFEDIPDKRKGQKL